MAGVKISPLMVLPPILFAALAAIFYFGMQRDDPNSLPSTLIGKQAPSFPTETLPNQLMPDADMIRDGQVKRLLQGAGTAPVQLSKQALRASVHRSQSAAAADRLNGGGPSPPFPCHRRGLRGDWRELEPEQCETA